MGVKTVMVTGDNPLTAKYIAERWKRMISLLKPSRKTRWKYIKKEQQAGKLVVMMGDGGYMTLPPLHKLMWGWRWTAVRRQPRKPVIWSDLDNDPTKLIEIVEIGKAVVDDTWYVDYLLHCQMTLPSTLPLSLLCLWWPSLSWLLWTLWDCIALKRPFSRLSYSTLSSFRSLIPLALKGVQV